MSFMVPVGLFSYYSFEATYATYGSIIMYEVEVFYGIYLMAMAQMFNENNLTSKNQAQQILHHGIIIKFYRAMCSN